MISFLVLLMGLGLPQSGSLAWWDAFRQIEETLALEVLVPLWVLLRAIDLVVGGPWRRRARAGSPVHFKPRENWYLRNRPPGWPQA